MRSVALAAAVPAILIPSSAPAGPASADRDVAIGLAFGPDLPGGEASLVIQYGPRPWLAVESGVGYDLGNARHDGPQSSLAVRVRTTGPVRVFAGVGASIGSISRDTQDDVCFEARRGCAPIAVGLAVWTDLEVGLEADLERSFVRLYGGVRVLDDPARVCVAPADPSQPCSRVGFFGAAVGVRL